MGYPLTWQRLLHRNALTDGDYNNAPTTWAYSPPYPRRLQVEKLNEDVDVIEAMHRFTEHQIQMNEAAHRRAMILAGDIRRLEKDTLDEREICRAVAFRTNVDVDTVAAVLKEFMSL